MHPATALEGLLESASSVGVVDRTSPGVEHADINDAIAKYETVWYLILISQFYVWLSGLLSVALSSEA